MGTYVYSRELGTEKGINYSVDVFKESNTEYRPIMTATFEDDFGMGCSERRSFKTEEEAREYYLENEEQLKKEALRELKSNK